MTVPEAMGPDFYRAVLEALSELVLVKDPESRILWANGALRRYYGVDQERLLAHVDAPHSNADDTLQHVRDDRFVLETGQLLEVDEPVTRHDGEVRYFRTRKSAVPGEGALRAYTVGISRELAGVSNREAAAAARGARRAELEAVRGLVDSLPVAVALTDVRGHLVAWSRGWEDAFGGSYGAALQAGELDVARLVEEVLAKEVPLSRPAAPVTTRAGARMLEVELRPWRLAERGVAGALVLAHDATARIAREGRLRDANAELAQVAYRVSHDLVAPLRTAIGWVDVVREELDAGDVEEAAAQLTRVEARLETLVLRLEELSEGAKADLVEEATRLLDLRAVVAEVLQGYAADAAAKEVSLENAVPALRVRLPKRALQAIVGRVVDNALRHGEGAVTVRFDADVPTLNVENAAGPGIPPELDIFGPFVRGTLGPGHGLGLYAARKYARSMGGELTLSRSSSPTRFSLAMPKGCIEGAISEPASGGEGTP
ncbi:MAG: PAS domain-containing protein [Myxococcota bacterium]